MCFLKKNIFLQNFTNVFMVLEILTTLSPKVHAVLPITELLEVSTDAKIRDEFVISTDVGISKVECAVRCHRYDWCNGASYRTASKTCEFCSEGVFSNTMDVSVGWKALKLRSFTTTSTTTTTAIPPSDCHDVKTQGIGSGSGVYSVYISSLSTWKSVYCDMDTDSGGWTVFQKRASGDVSFNKNALEYRNGFGDPSNEYWLGLSSMRAMTNGIPTELQLQFTDYFGLSAYEKYDSFSLGAANSFVLSLGNAVFFNTTQDTAGTNSGGSLTSGDQTEICQFISAVLGYRTQYDTNHYSAQQVRGVPDVYPTYGDEHGNWCASSDKSAGEYLELRINSAVRILNVSVYETYEAGSLTGVSTRTEGGAWQSLWSTSSVTKLSSSRIYTPTLSPINAKTRDIRIEMDLSNSWYEIDAVQVCGEVNAAPSQTMLYNNGAGFSSSDDDSDESSGNCADIHRGGWWFKTCTSINPNGLFSPNGSPVTTNGGQAGMIVPGWKDLNPVKETKLMFRRKT